MASFWRPGYDPRRRTLPAIAEDSEEETAALPTPQAGPPHAASNPRSHNQDERVRDKHDETCPRRPDDSEEDAAPVPCNCASRAKRLSRRLARHPEFRPHPGTRHVEEEEVMQRLSGAMHVLAEVREGVNVLRERLARRASQLPVARVREPEPEQLTYEDVERFVRVAAAEYQRRFAEP